MYKKTADLWTKCTRGERYAVIFVLISALSALLSLAGWLFNSPWLRGFGAERAPLWPWAAVGHVSLAIAAAAQLCGKRKIARIFWAMPIVFALVVVVDPGGRFETGFDRALFGALADAEHARHSGAVDTILLAFFLLGIAGLAIGEVNGRRNLAAGLIESAALSCAAALVLLDLFATRADGDEGIWATPLPGLIAAITLALAMFASTRQRGWARILAPDDRKWRLMKMMLPAVLLLPIIPAVIELLIERSDLLPSDTRELIATIGNIVILALICMWAVQRVAREQNESAGLSEALEQAAVAVTDSSGRIVHWPNGCEDLYGYSASEAIGQFKYALLRSRCEQAWAPGLPRKEDGDMQQLVEIRRDGVEIAVVERMRGFVDSFGERQWVLTMTDISRGAEAARALRHSEERLAVATAAHQVGIVEWNVMSGKLEWSPGAEQRLGLNDGDMDDFESWRRYVHPPDLEVVLATLGRVSEQRAEHFSYRYRLVAPNGSMRAVEGSSRAFFDTQGQLRRTVGIVVDVTEREEREAALRTSEAQLRSIVDTVPDPLVIIDEAGTIRRFSTAAEVLWEHRAQDVIGRPVATLLSGEGTQKLRDAMERCRASAPAEAPRFAPVTTTAHAANGDSFPVEISIGVSRADDTPLFTIFFRNLTERVAGEKRMSDLNAELAHVTRQSAMSELAADLAHELNQPLSAISNFLAAARMLIENDGDTERAGELLRMGSEQTHRAGEIIRRLREFMAKGEVEMRAEPLGATIREAAELVLLGASQIEIEVRYRLDPAARLVFVDRIQLQQVIVNLLRNASEALRTHGTPPWRIEIGSRKLNDQQVEVTVADNGPGISEALLSQIYARFTTTKDGTGMGIGLSISKRIIEAHGGILTAENSPEGGAVFRFTLPTVGEVELV